MVDAATARVAPYVRRLEGATTAYGSSRRPQGTCLASAPGSDAYLEGCGGLAGGDTVKDAHGDPHARLLR